MMKHVTREDSVAVFNQAGNNKTFQEDAGASLDTQWNCFDEESEELYEAIDNYVDALAQGSGEDVEATRAQLVKEWADVQVTLSNLAWYFGIPADAAFNRVHNSNMSKVSERGKLLYREDGKILKGSNYVAPDMKGL